MRGFKGMMVAVGLLIATLAHAEPGDAEAVAKARKDYAEALKGHDIGLQNAMRTQLSAQLAKSREKARNRHHTDAAHQHKANTSAS